jgi:hypothetical protein
VSGVSGVHGVFTTSCSRNTWLRANVLNGQRLLYASLGYEPNWFISGASHLWVTPRARRDPWLRASRVASLAPPTQKKSPQSGQPINSLTTSSRVQDLLSQKHATDQARVSPWISCSRALKRRNHHDWLDYVYELMRTWAQQVARGLL